MTPKEKKEIDIIHHDDGLNACRGIGLALLLGGMFWAAVIILIVAML